MKIFLAIFLVVLSSISYGGTIHPSIPDSKYLEFGEKFTCVKQIEIDYGRDEKDREIRGYSSCTILNDSWVVTSAHIALGAKALYVKHNGKRFFVKRMVINKDFNPDMELESLMSITKTFADIALCKVDEPMRDFDAAIMVDKNQEILNKVITICGFGSTGNFNIGVNKFDSKRRAGSNIISSIENDVLLAKSTRREKPTSLEFLVAGGDSGGGVFVDGKLLGVISFVRSDDKILSDFGDTSGFIDIRQYTGWINGIIKQ